MAQAAAVPKSFRPEKLGTTFSTVQCGYLGLDASQTRASLTRLSSMGFDTIRICAYWNRLDKGDRLDLDELFWQLDEVGRNGIKECILTIGLKAPRYPEFYIPARFLDKYPELKKSHYQMIAYPDVLRSLLDYNSQVIERTRDYPFIRYYQVENEPRNIVLVSDYQSIPEAVVKQEIAGARELIRSHQKILLTNSVGNPIIDSPEKKFYETLNFQPDAVGLNVYNKVPFILGLYHHVAQEFWDDQIVKWQNAMVARGVEPMIVESQAEPWEFNRLVSLDKGDHYPSANPQETVDLAVNLGKVGYKKVLLWGGEYWVAHHLRYGEEIWLRPMQKFMQSEQVKLAV